MFLVHHVFAHNGVEFPELELVRSGALVLVGGVVMTGTCLLYTSDAADERSSVDLGGRRIIKKKKSDSPGGACNGTYVQRTGNSKRDSSMT